MRGESFRIDVDGKAFDAFVQERYPSLRQMASDVGVDETTLRRARRNGFISLESAIEVCLAVDGGFEDVFGRQGDRLKTIVILAQK